MGLLSPLDALHLAVGPKMFGTRKFWVNSSDPQLVPCDPGWPLARDLERLRAYILRRFPQIADYQDEARMALYLLALVTNRVRCAGPTPDIDFENVMALVHDAVVSRVASHTCGGMTIIYLILARAFGLKARFVGMFDAVEDIGPDNESHCACDVLIGGRWHAMEPTYNVSFQTQRGQPLGWRQVRSAMERGVQVLVQPGLGGSLNRTQFNNHQQKLSALTRYMYIAACGDMTRESWLGWKGQLSYASGARFDYRKQVHSGIYRLLADRTGVKTGGRGWD